MYAFACRNDSPRTIISPWVFHLLTFNLTGLWPVNSFIFVSQSRFSLYAFACCNDSAPYASEEKRKRGNRRKCVKSWLRVAERCDEFLFLHKSICQLEIERCHDSMHHSVNCWTGKWFTLLCDAEWTCGVRVFWFWEQIRNNDIISSIWKKKQITNITYTFQSTCMKTKERTYWNLGHNTITCRKCLLQLSYVFADCFNWLEVLSAGRRLTNFWQNATYSRRMSLRAASTELKRCRQGHIGKGVWCNRCLA